MSARKQSGCVVFKYDKKGGYKILLVTSSNGKKWAFPKGGIESHLTKKESALKEVYEEAGVTGHIVKRLGEYKYRKAGRNQHVIMYAMLYVKDTSDWPERELRVRRWVSIEKARAMVPKELRHFLDALEDSDHVATATSNAGDLDHAFDHLMALPVLQRNGADITWDEEDECIVVKLRGLTLKVYENNEHFQAKKLTVEYFSESGAHHYKHVSIGSLTGFIGRICARYVSGHLEQ